MINTNMSIQEIEVAVKVHACLEAGYSAEEVAKTFDIPESTVREYGHVVDVAIANNFTVK